MRRGRPLKAIVAAAALVAAPVATSAALPAAFPGGSRPRSRSPRPCPPGSQHRRPPAPVSAAGRRVQHGGGLATAPDASQRLAEAAVARGEVLSQAEYDRRFGVPQAQVDAVATWLRARASRSPPRTGGGCRRGPGLGRGAAARPAHHAGHGRPAGARGAGARHGPVLPASLGVSAVLGLDTTTLACRRACGDPPYPATGPWSGTPAAPGALSGTRGAPTTGGSTSTPRSSPTPTSPTISAMVTGPCSWPRCTA